MTIDSPVLMRSGIAFLGLLGCAGACALGWKYFYDERKFLGASLICTGALCGLAGMGLLVASLFRTTWTWPL